MVVQYAAVRQILYVFCAYRLLIEEHHHRRRRGLIFYKLATLLDTAHSRPSSLHRLYISMAGCPSCQPNISINAMTETQSTNPNQWPGLILPLATIGLLTEGALTSVLYSKLT